MHIAKGVCHASLHKPTTVDFCPLKDLLKPEEEEVSSTLLKKGKEKFSQPLEV